MKLQARVVPDPYGQIRFFAIYFNGKHFVGCSKREATKGAVWINRGAIGNSPIFGLSKSDLY